MDLAEKRRKVEHLLRVKFPFNWEAPAADPSKGGLHERVRQQTFTALMAQIEQEREALMAKPDAEVARLFATSKSVADASADLAASLDEKRVGAPFYDASKVDFSYWAKADYWSIDESVALLLGKSPEIVTWAKVQPLVGTSGLAKQYQRLRNLAARADALARGETAVAPLVVLDWARDKDIHVPDDLRSAVLERAERKLAKQRTRETMLEVYRSEQHRAHPGEPDVVGPAAHSGSVVSGDRQLHAVKAVALEAAARRHPAPADADGRVVAEAWQDWTAATLLVQLNGYLHDRKATVFVNGEAVSGPHKPFTVPQEDWRVDEAGRAALLELFQSDRATVWPTVDIPPRPTAIPLVLTLLPADTRLLVRRHWDMRSEATSTAAEAVEQFTETMARQEQGWLQINEAAATLAQAGRGRAQDWSVKFRAAAGSGDLPTHEPGSLARVIYSSERRVRDGYEWVHVDDLNSWLDQHEPRMPYRFDSPTAVVSASEAEFAMMLDDDGVLSAFNRSALPQTHRVEPISSRLRAAEMADAVQLATPVETTRDTEKKGSTSGVLRHSTVGLREDILAPAIRKAEELAGAGATPSAVWAQLQRLAATTPAHPPLLDVVPDGVRYIDGIEEKTLTRKNLGDRLARSRRRATAR